MVFFLHNGIKVNFFFLRPIFHDKMVASILIMSMKTKLDLTGRYLLTLINRITKENRHQQGQVNHVHGKP